MVCDFLALAAPGVRSLRPYQPGKPVAELERELGISDVVKLASNENPLGPGAPAQRAAIGCLADMGRYPDGNGFALKAALAERLNVSGDALTLGNGSNDVLELVARAFVVPGQEVVYSQHAFAVYPLVTLAVGARPVVTAAMGWGHDLAAMADAVSEATRLIFVANPNNPTGTWVDEESLRAFMDRIPQAVIVVVDEAYAEYAARPGYPDCVPWVAEYPNLVVTRTFSKVHGLAGLRIGYSVSHPAVADLMNRVRQPFNVNLAAQAAATAALEDTDHVARSVALNRTGLARVCEGFDVMGLEYIPSAGNFVCVDPGRAGVEVFQDLLREGVIVRPVDNYGMPRHLRVTVGLPEENERFLAALGKVLGRA